MRKSLHITILILSVLVLASFVPNIPCKKCETAGELYRIWISNSGNVCFPQGVCGAWATYSIQREYNNEESITFLIDDYYARTAVNFIESQIQNKYTLRFAVRKDLVPYSKLQFMKHILPLLCGFEGFRWVRINDKDNRVEICYDNSDNCINTERIAVLKYLFDDALQIYIETGSIGIAE
ncbi:MAG: hypothetical protein IKR93_04840 [Firmicutes bacterium]|nr:hypothetical protein [Bacillota bacterium]